MKLRKFEIVSITESPGGPGPERAWDIKYTAIKNKEWQSGNLWVIAKNKQEARDNAMKRWGGSR